MKVQNVVLSTISVLLAAVCLSGCSAFKTPLTDELKLTATYDGETFTNPSDGNNAIGEVTLSSVTDGDTLNFVDGVFDDVKTSTQAPLPLRFLGVNTPESTARIEPWGVKASQWVKSILWDDVNEKQIPYRIVFQNDYSVFSQRDGNDRYLGFVWYKLNEGSDYRLLNLEIIEQCYSLNFLSTYSSFCPYLDYFVAAAKTAKDSGKRVYGEKDPGYDYTDAILDVTIRDIRENFANYGVSDTAPDASGDSGIRLRVTGLILEYSGNNAFIRDVTNAYSDGTHASIYVFTALTVSNMATLYEPGEIITFVCRATTYSNNIQLTDVIDQQALGDDWRIISQIGKPSRDFNISGEDWNDETKLADIKKAAHDKGVEKGVVNGWDYDVKCYDISSKIATVQNAAGIEPYVGTFAQIQLTVRSGDSEDASPTQGEAVSDYYRLNADGDNLLVFAKLASGVKLNMRTIYFQAGWYKKGSFALNVTYNVVGLISKYYDTYQIQIPNSYPSNGPSCHYTGTTKDGYKWIAA